MKKRLFLRLPALLLAILLCAGCSSTQTQEKQTASVFAMDTIMELTAYGSGAEEALADISAMLTELDGRLSVTGEGSEIYALNHASGAQVTVSEDTCSLLRNAIALGQSVDGALDISLYPVLRAWGFTTSDYRIPSEEELAELLQRVDAGRIVIDDTGVTLPEGMEIDLGSVAKGYAADKARETLEAAGVISALLNLGASTVCTVGAKPDGSAWRVAVQDPCSDSGYAGILAVTDCAVDTSGGYERYFTGDDGTVYWHIIDPATGEPARSGLLSVTIVSDSAFLGDGLSTACFVMGADETIRYWRENGGFEFVLITEEGSLLISEGLADSFTPAGDYTDSALQLITKTE